MARHTIGAGLHWITATAVAAIAILLIWAYNAETGRADAARAAQLQTAVDAATAIAAAYEREEHTGSLSHEAAQSNALAAIKAIRFRRDASVLVTDFHPRMVMDPVAPERDGSELTGVIDAKGTAVFVAFVKKVLAQGAGVVAYSVPRQEGAGQVTARAGERWAYVQGFPPWGWILSGSDDVEDLASSRWYLVRVLVSLGIAAAGIIALVVELMGCSLSRRIRELAVATELLSQGDLSARIVGAKRRDELGALAFALDGLKRAAVDRQRIVRVGLEERAAKERRQAAMDSLTRDFSEVFSGVLTQLSHTARQIAGTARDIAGCTGRATNCATRAVTDWSGAARDLRVMAAGAVELSACLDTIVGRIVKTAAIEGAPTEVRTASRQLSLVAEWVRGAGDKMTAIAARADDLTNDAAAEGTSLGSDTRALGEAVATSSEDLGHAVETLRDEVDQFIGSLVQGDTFRRRYERVPGKGALATLIVPDGVRASAVIQDISRGGAALLSTFQGNVGDGVLVALPGSSEPVSARVVRYTDGVVAVAFRQDRCTMAEVDAAVDMVMRGALETLAS